MCERVTAQSDIEFESSPCSSWSQVAGDFDGDGIVGLEVVKRVSRLKLRFVDTWPQIMSIAALLEGHGLRFSNIGRDEKARNWQPRVPTWRRQRGAF